MHKKKSHEYLDKINQAFEQLTDPAHEIDIDSLLGYIRIFYSSVKSIPIEATNSNKPYPIQTPVQDVVTEVDTNSNSTVKENLPVEKNENINPPEVKIDDVKTEEAVTTPIETEEETKEKTVVEPLVDAVNEKETIEDLNPPKAEVKEAEPQILPIEKVEEEIVEDNTSSIEELELVENVVETNNDPMPEIKTVLPAAEAQEIKIQQEVVAQQEMIEIQEEKPEPAVDLYEKYKKEISGDQPTYQEVRPEPVKNNILTQIENVQKPLYTPDNQRVHNPSDAIESLFKEKSPTGLVDFLGLSPLDNLNKAWGLNEKMLVIKDLFNDDFNAFNETVEMVNKLSSFNEVKSYLIDHVVNRFQWNDLSRFKKASDFIVQTKRLFVK